MALRKLGEIYDKGLRVPEDYVQAHMWLNHPQNRLEKHNAQKLELIEKKMTLEQIKKAEGMAKKRGWHKFGDQKARNK